MITMPGDETMAYITVGPQALNHSSCRGDMEYQPVVGRCEKESCMNGNRNNESSLGERPACPEIQLTIACDNGDDENGTSEEIDLKNERSDLLSIPSSPSLVGINGKDSSRWRKLRNTVKLAGAVTSNQTRRRRQGSGLGRQDSFLKRFSTRQGGGMSSTGRQAGGNAGNTFNSDSEDETKIPLSNEKQMPKQSKRGRLVIHPDENFMFYWLAGVTGAFLYNMWTCIAREAFRDIQEGYETIWLTLDATSDMIYLMDIGFQMRTGYLEKGLVVYDSKKLAKHYIRSSCFIFDVVSLMPIDLVQIFIGFHPIIRFPRFIKAYRAYWFSHMVETRTVFPNVWRVANWTHLLFLGSHWFAAFYYMISKAEDFHSHWGYHDPIGERASVARKYLKSLYWSTLTLTTIGDLPPPESNWEYAFTIVSYLIGVFVFATIVGQVGNVITSRNASRQEFERLLDGAKAYMRNHNVPQDMQRRVQRWYDYAWSRGRMNGGGDINSLGLLPDKLKTEMALHVNLVTLKKVTIFQECEPEFLHDLVLKMKAFIFTPGDLICRKGEVAREMFIIADGLLEVISDSGEVLTQMCAGDFFGEIGILNLDGGVNRRTADVRSVGYAELFVLSREDVLSALKDHPEAEAILIDHGRKRLIGIKQKNEEDAVAGKIRSHLSSQREEATPSPITNLLGVRITGSRLLLSGGNENINNLGEFAYEMQPIRNGDIQLKSGELTDGYLHRADIPYGENVRNEADDVKETNFSISPDNAMFWNDRTTSNTVQNMQTVTEPPPVTTLASSTLNSSSRDSNTITCVHKPNINMISTDRSRTNKANLADNNCNLTANDVTMRHGVDDSAVLTVEETATTNVESGNNVPENAIALIDEKPAALDVTGVMESVRMLLEQNLQTNRRQFDERVRHLEAENKEKDEKIFLLQLQVQNLQRALANRSEDSDKHPGSHPTP